MTVGFLNVTNSIISDGLKQLSISDFEFNHGKIIESYMYMYIQKKIWVLFFSTT